MLNDETAFAVGDVGDRVPARMGSVGQRIRRARLTKGWTQGDLAKACGWSGQSRVSHYERGTREPSGEDLRTLARALDTTPAWLAFEEGVSTPSEKLAPLEQEIERLVRALPLQAGERVALSRMLIAWAGMPPLFREYIARKAAELRNYTDQLPPVVQMSLKTLPTGPEYERFERSLEQEMRDYLVQTGTKPRRLPRPIEPRPLPPRQPTHPRRKEKK